LLSLSVGLLTLAVLAGTILGLWHLRGAASGPPMSAGIAHGLSGAAGLAALLLALRGPPRGVAAGAGSFGTTSAVLFVAALACGVAVFLLRRKGNAVVMAIHAGLAITGYVLLLAWSSFD
jgi:hypothetical protein